VLVLKHNNLVDRSLTYSACDDPLATGNNLSIDLYDSPRGFRRYSLCRPIEINGYLWQLPASILRRRRLTEARWTRRHRTMRSSDTSLKVATMRNLAKTSLWRAVNFVGDLATEPGWIERHRLRGVKTLAQMATSELWQEQAKAAGHLVGASRHEVPV